MKPLKLERLFLKLACTYFSLNNCLLSTGVCVCVCVCVCVWACVCGYLTDKIC